MNAIAKLFNNPLVPGQSSGQVGGTDSKIRSFGRLPNGWHYGRGSSASDCTIRIAREYLALLMLLGFFETDAFPGVSGEIMVTAYRGKHRIEVTVGVDRKFTVAHEFDHQEQFYDSELSGLKTYDALRTITTNIEQEECSISSWSTQNTMITGTAGLSTWHSKHPMTGAVLQSYWSSAGLPQPGQFAHTYKNITQVSAENRLYSGRSTTPSLPRRVK